MARYTLSATICEGTMIYTAEDLVNRAYNLADIKNTDFLSYEENIQYLNDSWTTLYQTLINKGDKQFITEAILNTTSRGPYSEYKLPFDFYQMYSLKSEMGMIVPRRVESDGLNLSYEIVNDKLRVYGGSPGNLIITYYRTPLYLSYPRPTMETTISNPIVDSCGVYIYESNGNIFDVRTAEVVGSIEYDRDITYRLSRGYMLICIDGADSLKATSWVNFKGEQIGPTREDTPLGYWYDRFGNIYYTIENEEEEYTAVGLSTSFTTTEKNGILGRYHRISYDENTLYIDDIPAFEGDISNITYVGEFDGRDAIVGCIDGKYYHIAIDNKLHMNEIELREPIVLAITSEGLITSDGTNQYIVSYIPNTSMNFPNELFFSLVSYELAMRYAMKQNADYSGLKQGYDNAYLQWMNSLSQNANYGRIVNIY